jgi:neutral amino acid transport system permease protein
MIGYSVFLIISTAIFAIFTLGLNLQWGFTGLINFGHVAFMTVGVYTTVLLSRSGVPLIIAVIAGMMMAAFLGLLIGTSTLKLREDYLAIVTIGSSELIRLIAKNEEWLTEGTFGVHKYPKPLENLDPNLGIKFVMIAILTLLGIWTLWQLGKNLRRSWQVTKQIKNKSYKPRSRVSLTIWGGVAVAIILFIYVIGIIALYNYNYKAGLMLLSLLILSLVYWGLEFLVKSPWGRILKAIREDEEIPKALGKNVFWYKLQSFMLGGAIAGLAGAFYAWQFTVYPDNFQPLLTFNAWMIVVLGGAGNNAGTILGTIIFWVIFEPLTRFLTSQHLGILDSTQQGPFRIMIIGLILIVLMIWRPQGILGRKEELTLGK